MIRHTLLLGAALVATVVPAALAAQAVVQPLSNADADALSAQMRLLASDPRNVQALATAGELSMRLGDLSGAAALFARADKVDPRSGRVKAGMGSILVRSERPGEALRFFSQAEAYGYPAARYAADRGLAFDLVGQQGRAQRDYRLALQNGDRRRDDAALRAVARHLGAAGAGAGAARPARPAPGSCRVARARVRDGDDRRHRGRGEDRDDDDARGDGAGAGLVLRTAADAGAGGSRLRGSLRRDHRDARADRRRADDARLRAAAGRGRRRAGPGRRDRAGVDADARPAAPARAPAGGGRRRAVAASRRARRRYASAGRRRRCARPTSASRRWRR